jgi:hypothetical protein
MPSRSALEVLKSDHTQQLLAVFLIVVVLLSIDWIK